MSILENLINSITGNDEQTAVEHPCSNCPSDCSLCPDACEICSPYKTKLIDVLYNVEHLDEFRARYEVTGTADESTGTTVCPYCGAPSADPDVCEYCGMQIRESDGKIHVEKASDIPNPVLEAQDIIFERYSAVSATDSGSESSTGILGNLLNLVSGDDDSDSNPLGSKMTEDEINSMASDYGVSVSAYLTGLDNGKYLTLTAKAAEDKRKAAASVPTALGAAGLGVAAGSVISNRSNNRNYGYTNRSNTVQRPTERPENNFSGRDNFPPSSGMPNNAGFDRRGNSARGAGMPAGNEQRPQQRTGSNSAGINGSRGNLTRPGQQQSVRMDRSGPTSGRGTGKSGTSRSSDASSRGSGASRGPGGNGGMRGPGGMGGPGGGMRGPGGAGRN